MNLDRKEERKALVKLKEIYRDRLNHVEALIKEIDGGNEG